ncbi:LuxR C-terminal-related transcriptional regulator [Mycobacterium tuberculosis]|uniref:LuxR C-terminal-related transcriptional regulator n=1 Tax=Mycobacterium tuberculosis TaxID=1773 RepID=UPI003D093101
MSKLLPRGTVTLLLADVEGSTWLWETHPDDMGAAVARLDKAVSGVIAAHDGVRPVEQGEGDSFVLAFACASDAVAAALDLQRARLAPIRLRIGVHTGEVALRDEGNYAGPTINRTARLRDLAHGGQTVLSGVTESLVIDRLPDKAWLVDLGTHALRDLSRPERVMQLCHPELRIDFPPLRVANDDVAHGLPVHLTRFVGRGAQITEVHRLVTDNRLVTLTGAGTSDTEGALALASSLLRVWMTRGRIQEGRAWFDSILADENARHLEVAAAVRARALADKALLDIFVDAAAGMEQAQQALVIAREVDEPALLSRALTACGLIAVAVARADAAASYFAEAIDLARAVDDRWRLAQILTFQAVDAVVAGDPVAARPAAQEARELAAAIGDHSNALWCRWCLGYAQLMRGELAAAAAQFGEVVDEAEASQEVLHKANSLQGLAFALAYQGELSAARAAADAALEAAELGEYFAGMGYSALTTAALAAGDVQTAQHASEAAWRNLSLALPLSAAVQRAFNAQAALAGGDLSAARRWCDDAVQSMTGHHLAMALATRARIAVAEGKREEAERDAHKALACAAESGAHLDLPDVLECLAGLASDAGTHHAAARLFGAAEAIRQQIGSVRFAIYRSDYVQSVTALRDAMGEKDFDAAWAEGAALSIKETIAYAQRGHSWRKRPATGWESLTPTEIDVVRLVGEGLANKDIATRLFVSPRTVQTHLTHVYTKLGFTSRLQLAQAAARRT